MSVGLAKVAIVCVALGGAPWLWGSVALAASPPLDATECHLSAVATPDNDIRVFKDTRAPGTSVAVPPVVAEQLAAAANRFLGEVDTDVSGGLTCESLFPDSVYRVSAALQRNLYVVDISGNFGISFFYLVLHDPVTGTVTADPPRIYAKWVQGFGRNDPMVETPFVSSADLFQDHNPQIVFEEQVHNGTVYNGVVYHYFEVGPNLELTRVAARETRVIMFDRGPFLREFTSLAPTRLRLDIFEDPKGNASQRKDLGYAILESEGIGRPFHISEQHPTDKDIDQNMVTLGGVESQDDFLRHGYTEYY